MAGVMHSDPFERETLRQWLSDHKEAYSAPPLFVAVESTPEATIGVRNNRLRFVENVGGRNIAGSPEALSALYSHIGFEVDEPLEFFPESPILWLETVRIDLEANSHERVISNRIALYKTYLEGAPVEDSDSAKRTIRRNAEKATRALAEMKSWKAGKDITIGKGATYRDEGWCSLADAEIRGRAGWAIFIIGANHIQPGLMEDDDRPTVAQLLQNMGHEIYRKDLSPSGS